MFCKNCGAQIPGQAKFCPKCGVVQQMVNGAVADAVTPVQASPSNDRAPKKTKGKKLLCVVLVLVIFAGAGAVAAAFLPDLLAGHKDVGETPDVAEATTEAVAAETEEPAPVEEETVVTEMPATVHTPEPTAKPEAEAEPEGEAEPVAEAPVAGNEREALLQDLPEPVQLAELVLGDDGYYRSGDYVFSIDEGVASLYSYEGQASALVIPETVSYEGISYKIRTVASKALEGNVYLNTLVIPQSVTQVNSGAFKDCTNLQLIVIQGDIGDCDGDSAWYANDAAFYNAGANSDSLVVVFDENVTYVPAYLFRTPAEKSEGTYAHITELYLGDAITEIGREAFYGCYDLKSIFWGSELRAIGEAAFAYDTALRALELPVRLTDIGTNAFIGCVALQRVVLPERLVSLGRGAFNDCTNLMAITIQSDIGDCDSDSVWYAGDTVFFNAGANTDYLTVTFTEGVTRVPAYLFATPSNKSDGTYAHVTEIVFADSIAEVCTDAFLNCHDLKEITWGTGLKVIGEGAFMNASSLEALTLPEGVTTLYKEAFASCPSLGEIVLPRTLTSIAVRAFDECTGLSLLTIHGNLDNCDSDSAWTDDDTVFSNAAAYTEGLTVRFGEGVTYIPAYLFATPYDKGDGSYTHITKVVLPESLTEIGRNAFYNCHDLLFVEYAGTEDQYSTVVVGEENTSLTELNVLIY